MERSKEEIREFIRNQKKLLTAEEKLKLSATVLEKLEKNELFLNAKNILLYWSLPDEVTTHDFIEKWSIKKNILLPVVIGNDLEIRKFSSVANMQVGAFGIQEPVGEIYSDKIDIAIIPGVAFCKNGIRLGRGKGFYDRFLSSYKGIKIGICFPFQVLTKIPTEPTDINMNIVIYG